MASTKVTFVTGTAEVRRIDPHRDYSGPVPGEHLTTEPSVPCQVNYVDGKCTCCPYGYHIDLDFLNFCKDVESGSTLRNLKRIQRAKRKLRKSMEIMLDEQGRMISNPNSAPPDVVHKTEAGRLMHMINYERSATHRILNQIDSSVNTTIANNDGRGGQRYMCSDSDDPVTPYTFLPQGHGPPYLIEESGHPSFSNSGRTDSLSSLSSVSTVSSEAPMLHQAHLYQQQQQLYQHSLSSKVTTKVIENPVIEMATAEMKYQETPVLELGTAEMKHQETPVLELGTAEMKHYSTYSSAQLANNGMSPPPPPPHMSPSPDINQMSLHSVREAMAVSLHRLRELEEQIKAIPILQVRISVLKEEKRLLNLQLKASYAISHPTTRSIGVGEGRVDVIDIPREFSTLPKPVRTFSVGVGDNSVIEPYLLQPELPTGYTIRDNETHTENHTTTFIERDSVFGSRVRAPSLNMSFQHQSSEDRSAKLSSSYYSATEASQPHFTINQIQRSSPKALTRTFGVGDGNVFEGSGLHVHEKEFRTVFIGQNNSVAKRNVGIECRVATRDVGVSFRSEEVKPETRSIGVNVNYDMSNIHTSLDFKGESELRVALRGVLQRNVKSIGTNCNFKASTMNVATSMEMCAGVDVGCGDHEMRTDVEIRMPTIRKSASVTAKPETGHKCVSTDKDWIFDVGTNTILIDKYNKASMTEKQRYIFAATNTDVHHTRQSGAQTEVKMFLAMDQLKNAYSATEKIRTYSKGMTTDTIPVYNAITNTTENVTDLFRKSEDQKTSVTTEIISRERKPLMIDQGVGDGLIEEPYSFSETTEIITTKLASPTREEQIVQRGASQANAFLSQSTAASNVSGRSADTSSFSSYEISRRSKMGSSDRSEDSHKELVHQCSSQVVLDQKNSEFDLASPTKEEDGFSETVVEHYIITDEGKTLVSKEKTRSTTSGKNKIYEQSSGGNVGDAGGCSGESSSKQLASTSGSMVGIESYCSASEDRNLGGRSMSGNTYSSSFSTNSTNNKSNNNLKTYHSGGNANSVTSVSSQVVSASSGYGGSSWGSGSSDTIVENNYSQVVTNPYRTVENLAAASSLIASDSTASESSNGRMSKTSSDGNLYKEKRHSAIDMRQSMDTIYDMRRAGSVEDFMPDDIRKYMSIDPCPSKDSGFGEDLLQKFAEEASSSLRTSSDKRGPMKSTRVSKTVTTKSITRTGADGKTVVQETKSIVGPNGKTTVTVTETDTDGVAMNVEPSDSAMTQSTMLSSSSSTAGRYGIESESNLSAGLGMEMSDSSSHCYSESTMSTEGTGDQTHGSMYGSMDRKTGKLRSIMKKTKAEDSERMGGKKGITFVESVTGGYELTEQVREACTVLATYLMDSTTIQTKQLNSSLNIIQQEWFRVSSHKLSCPHQVEDYLSSVNEISKRLLEYIVNMTDANGNTAIHYCISHCNFEIGNLLLDSEVCDINKQNMAGYTPTMLAGLASPQNMEQWEIVRRLFSTGDINVITTATQQTALMLAASHGRTDMVSMLVEEGADINVQDVDGSTALMCACEHGHLEIVNFLLACPNIDANITDNENSTALTIAMEAGHKDIGVVLYKHLNFSPKVTGPGYHKKRKGLSSPTPSL